MFMPRRILPAVAGLPLLLSLVALTLVALPPAHARAGQATDPADEAAEKARLLDSECWRRALFEMNSWFRTQTIYTPDEVAELRADFDARVEAMSVQELKEVIADLDAKFRILESPQVQETRAWFGQYMSVLADRRREEILREIPDFLTMTPAQLNQAIMKIQRKKTSQRSFNRTRQAKVDAQLETNRAARVSAARSRAASRSTAYRSPYRPQSFERPFDNVQPGPRRNMTIGPNGGVWMTMGL